MTTDANKVITSMTKFSIILSQCMITNLQ